MAAAHLLEKYKISFTEKRISFNSEHQLKTKIAVHEVPYDYWGYFLNHFKSVSDIDEIIGDIDFIFSEGKYDPEYCLEIYLQSLTVRYTDTTALFLDKNEKNSIEEVPLFEMKEILLLWKDFIQADTEILKESHKPRIDLKEVQWGDYDYDGSRLVLYNEQLYTGYVIFTKYRNGIVKAEVEYNSGSHIGWENEYNEAGILVYSCYSMGETTQEVYKYDDEGNLIDFYEL